MIKIGERWAGNKALDDAMVSAHNLDIRVELMDLNHKVKKDISRFFDDGAVSVDADAQVTRALDLRLFDPQFQVSVEPYDPSRTSVYIADMIRVTYIVSTPDRQKVWEIPVFTGPIDDVTRDNFNLDIKCLGKESLALSNLWRGKTYKNKQTRTDVIKDILSDAGENFLDIPDRKQTLPKDLKLNSEDNPWQAAKKLAHSMGFQLFYDGRGVATMRKRTKTSKLKLDARWVTTYPRVSYDLRNVVNAVRVIGGKPSKNKPKIRYTQVAKRKHPLSPWRLGRGGKPRFLWLEIDDDSIRSKAEAREVAKRELNQGLMVGIQPSFDGIPHPRLEELDVITVALTTFWNKFSVKQFTIPLMAGDDSSYGYLRRARPKGGARGVKVNKKNRRQGGRS